MAPDLLISGDSVSTEMDGVPATIVAMTEDARQLTEVDYDLIEFARRIVDSNSDGLVCTARSVIAHPPASPNRQIGAPHRIGDRHGACSRPRSPRCRFRALAEMIVSARKWLFGVTLGSHRIEVGCW